MPRGHCQSGYSTNDVMPWRVLITTTSLHHRLKGMFGVGLGCKKEVVMIGVDMGRDTFALELPFYST